MARNIRFIALTLLCVMLVPTLAHAEKYDISLWRFCKRDATTGQCLDSAVSQNMVQADNAKFARFTEQLAAVIAPKYHAPAETLGWLGWNLGLEFTLNDIPSGSQWDDALEGVERVPAMDQQHQKSRSAPSLLNTVQFHARKGFPFSTELGMTATYIINSKMFALGIEGKFAFVEGFTYVPDMALRMTYSHLFNAQDMDMDLFGWDLSISKNFGIGGFFQIAPYTGYSLLYSIASPHVVNSSFDPANNSRLLALDKQHQLIHRWFMGVRMIATYLSFTPEIQVSSAEVYSYSFNLGAEW